MTIPDENSDLDSEEDEDHYLEWLEDEDNRIRQTQIGMSKVFLEDEVKYSKKRESKNKNNRAAVRNSKESVVTSRMTNPRKAKKVRDLIDVIEEMENEDDEDEYDIEEDFTEEYYSKMHNEDM